MVPKITCRNYFESEGPAWQGLLRYIHLPIRSTNYNLTGKYTNNFRTMNNKPQMISKFEGKFLSSSKKARSHPKRQLRLRCRRGRHLCLAIRITNIPTIFKLRTTLDAICAIGDCTIVQASFIALGLASIDILLLHTLLAHVSQAQGYFSPFSLLY